MAEEKNNFNSVNKALQNHVPAAAVHYCYRLWVRYPFVFKLSRPRKSKSGDYRYIPGQKKNVITVNQNLNCYSFLITYIHEVAHLVAFEQHGRKIPAHGNEWKITFIRLMRPLLTEAIFPDAILTELYRHFKNPKASTAADTRLMTALNEYDDRVEGDIILDQLPEGEVFTYRSKAYRKIYKRRTRILCEEQKTKKRYLISRSVVVSQINI